MEHGAKMALVHTGRPIHLTNTVMLTPTRSIHLQDSIVVPCMQGQLPTFCALGGDATS